MSKKYTVKDFCKEYSAANNDKTKELLVENAINPNYVPYETKVAICENIIGCSYYIKSENNGIEVKKLHINSPSKYMLYCLNLIKYYTNIEVDFKNALNEFNLLNKCGALDVIYSMVSEKELKEFRMILDMVENDTVQNEYGTHAFISNQVERFGDLFGGIIKPALDRLSDVVENMDEKTVEKMVDKLKGFNGLKGKFNIVK